MFISPQRAEAWIAAQGTAHGAAVMRMLGPFCESPLALAPPVQDLEGVVSDALAGLGLPRAAVETVSVGDVKSCIGRLPEAMRHSAAQGMAGAIMLGQLSTLDDLLERTVGKDLPYRALSQEIVGPLVNGLDRELRALATTGLRLGLASALSYHASALAAGRADLAAKLAPFTRLFRAGNYPMGPLRGGSFLVLTA